MQKYLTKKSKLRKSTKQESEYADIKKLRSMLERNEQIKKQFLEQCMEKDKTATARQILLFKKYEQFKKIIHKYLSLEDIGNSRDLGPIYDEYQSEDKKIVEKHADNKNNNSQPNKKKISWEQIKKIITVIAGVMLLIITVLKRHRLAAIVKKILV